MIIEDQQSRFDPWPEAGPGYGTSKVWAGTLRNLLVAEWESWPSELRDPLMVLAPSGRGAPKAWAGPKAEIVQFSTVGPTSGGVTWGGLFMSGYDTILVASHPQSSPTTFAHEWGHLVDYSWMERAQNAPRRTMTNVDGGLVALYEAVVDELGSGTSYYRSTIREWFAQCFAGYARRERSILVDVCGPHADAVIAYLVDLLPYQGAAEALAASPLGRMATVSAGEQVACGGVVDDVDVSVIGDLE